MMVSRPDPRSIVRFVGFRADQQSHAGGRSFGGSCVNEDGTGSRADKRLDVLTVFKKADVFRPCGFERRHVSANSTTIRWIGQICTAQRGQRIERKGPSSMKKPWVRHPSLISSSRLASA
jgi:hypothetical protein